MFSKLCLKGFAVVIFCFLLVFFWCSYDVPLGFLCFFVGCPLVSNGFHLFPCGFPMIFVWFSFGFHMVLMWFSCGVPVVFQWFPLVF